MALQMKARLKGALAAGQLRLPESATELAAQNGAVEPDDTNPDSLTHHACIQIIRLVED